MKIENLTAIGNDGSSGVRINGVEYGENIELI